MQLLNPTALFLLLALPLGVLFLFLKKKKASTKQLLIAIPRKAIKTQLKRSQYKQRALLSFFLIGLALIIFSLARPIERQAWTKKFSEGIDIVIALDVSESMDATDFQPNRITVAKQVIQNFVEKRGNDRIGLVIFGGEAVTKAPLTRDYNFLLRQLESVQLRELAQGTAIGMALANAVGRLEASKSKSKVIILLTDGDSNVGSVNPITATTLAKEEGIKIYSIGIGKNARVLVPLYAYDGMGNRTHLITQVPSYLNPELLDEIASRTGGKSYMAKNPDSLRSILNEIDSLETSKVEITPLNRNDELFFYSAVAGLILLTLAYCLKEFRFWRRDPSYV